MPTPLGVPTPYETYLESYERAKKYWAAIRKWQRLGSPGPSASGAPPYYLPPVKPMTATEFQIKLDAQRAEEDRLTQARTARADALAGFVDDLTRAELTDVMSQLTDRLSAELQEDYENEY